MIIIINNEIWSYWFKDQNSQPLVIEDRINLKICYSIEPRDQIYVKGYEFSSFAIILSRIVNTFHFKFGLWSSFIS